MFLLQQKQPLKCALLALIGLLATNPLVGQAPVQNELTELKRIVHQQQSVIQQQSDLLERQMKRFEALEAQSSNPPIGFASESRPVFDSLPSVQTNQENGAANEGAAPRDPEPAYFNKGL